MEELNTSKSLIPHLHILLLKHIIFFKWSYFFNLSLYLSPSFSLLQYIHTDTSHLWCGESLMEWVSWYFSLDFKKQIKWGVMGHGELVRGKHPDAQWTDHQLHHLKYSHFVLHRHTCDQQLIWRPHEINWKTQCSVKERLN